MNNNNGIKNPKMLVTIVSIIIIIAGWGGSWYVNDYKIDQNKTVIDKVSVKADANQMAIVGMQKDIEYIKDSQDKTVKILERMERQNGRENP